MEKTLIPHDPLIKATIAYMSTPDVREDVWSAIDTSAHPAVPSLVEAMRAIVAKDLMRARSLMDTSISMVSASEEPELFLACAITNARLLSSEKGANAALQHLASHEVLIESASPVLRMAAEWRLGTLCRGVGTLAEAFNHFSAARTIAESQGWEYDVALLKAELGAVYLETGDPVKAIAHLEEAYHTLNHLGDTQYAYLFLMNLALAHGRIGETSTAERLTEEAVDRRRREVDFDLIVDGLLNLASLKKSLGKIDEAQAIYQEVLDHTEPEPLNVARVRSLIGAGSICNFNGDHHAALDYLDRAKALAGELGQTVMALDIDAKRADVYRDLGERERSVEILRTTFAALSTHTYTHYTIHAGGLLERWLVEDGHHAEAYDVLKLCTDLQREVYKKESERALQLSSVRQNMETERNNLRLREEERRALLQQVLPLPIADRIMAGERRIAEQIDMVGILFADIVGFTQSSAGKTPSEVLELLEDLFHAVDEVVTSHGCEKIKSIGDSYMATSATSAGHTSADPAQSIIRLARCGLDMLDLLQTSRHAHVQLRIGMHAGPVVAGVMDGMRLAFDMWGDTVNVASRMESTSAPGRFQTTAAVADLLRSLPEFKITPRDTINVKGRGEMATYWVERGE